jgi:hypothetical protein
MNDVVTYIEVDVDYCSREYGDGLTGGAGACLAHRGSGWPEGGRGGVIFSGHVEKDFPGFTGIADSKKFTIIGSVRPTAGDGTVRTIFNGRTSGVGTTWRFRVYLTAGNALVIAARNTGHTDILEVVSPDGVAEVADGWLHFAASVDLSDSGKRHFIVNGVEAGTWNTYTDDTIAFTNQEWALSALQSSPETEKFTGVVGRLWFEDDLYVDLATNLALVWDTSGETGMPVYLGPSGESITGSPPILFQASNDWLTAYGTGGNFEDLVGTETESPFVTGPRKCFNTLKTCQDPDNFDAETVTHRFSVSADYLSQSIDAIPSIVGVAMSPAVVSLGENLGVRSSVTVEFEDHPWPDTGDGFDKYHSERDYDPYHRGSFWAKFRSRQPFLIGKPLRVIRGTSDQALADMETRHFFIESTTGPSVGGRFQIVAKDGLKFADDDRAQAPAANNGYLDDAITDSDTSATLLPAGIGDDEYPASGHLNLGGNEVVSFTRSGDDLTITRAQLGTEAVAHAAEDRAQLVLTYTADDAADIIYDLFVNYTELTSAELPLADWQEETAAYLQNVYTATIAEPTGVNKLVSELVEQAGLALWWDEIDEQVKLRVLRAIPAEAATIDGDTYIEGSLKVDDQPTKRLSQVWTYFGQRDPTRPLDETSNYAQAELKVDVDAQGDYGSPAVKTILSRWIPALGRSLATRLNNIVLGRYRDPPRRVSFSLLRTGDVEVERGDGIRVGGWNLQDETGEESTVPVVITSVQNRDAHILVEGEEANFAQLDPADLVDRVITVDTNLNDLNLRTVHDALFPAITTQDVANSVTLKCIIASGVIVGSTAAGTSGIAFDVGDWPAGLPLTIVINGRIQGKGGDGGRGGKIDGLTETSPTNGEAGGTALYTRFAIDVELNSTGEIWGGGGAGAGARGRPLNQPGGGGGAGQGKTPSLGGAATSPATAGADSTPEAPGSGGAGTNNNAGGDGGAKGAAGDSAAHGSATPGAAGRAIDGVSNITFTVNDGDRVGSEVN